MEFLTAVVAYRHLFLQPEIGFCQFFSAFFELLLEELLVVLLVLDIGTGADPFDDPPLIISKCVGSDNEPAIESIGAPDTILHLIGVARADRMLPPFHSRPQIVGMACLLPRSEEHTSELQSH